MPISPVTAIDCLALSAFLYTLFVFREHRRRRGLPYPPGPPSLPVIGNLLDVPKLAPWLAYANMSKKYGTTGPLCCFAYVHGLLSGDVVCLEAFGQVVVILSSLTAIKDLVEKRGELYADRTPFPIFEMFALPFFIYFTFPSLTAPFVVPEWTWRGCSRSPERESTGAKAEDCSNAVSALAQRTRMGV
jgi:hypothetical protein